MELPLWSNQIIYISYIKPKMDSISLPEYSCALCYFLLPFVEVKKDTILDFTRRDSWFWWACRPPCMHAHIPLTRHNSWFWQAYRLPCTHIPPFLYTASGTCMHRTVKLQYSVDNLGEVGSTALYPPSWIWINSVCKVANAAQTLQLCKS